MRTLNLKIQPLRLPGKLDFTLYANSPHSLHFFIIFLHFLHFSQFCLAISTFVQNRRIQLNVKEPKSLLNSAQLKSSAKLHS